MGLVRTPDGRVWETAGDYSIGEDFAIGDDDDDFELIGEDFLFGDDDDDDDDYGADMVFAGKKRKRSRKSKLRALKRRALARMAGGFSARSKMPTDGRRLPQPIGPTVIAAGTTVNIQVQPQNSIKVQQLVIRSTNAALFDILELSVGTDNQFVSSGTLNGDMFSSATQQDVQLKGSTANLGNIITLRVQNLDTVNAQTFYGMILGPTIRSFG